MHWIEIIGRSHSLWVHLPIGILVLGLLLFWRKRLGYRTDNQLMVFIFGLAAVTALLSCISGYTLSLEGDNDAQATESHRNSALFLTFIALLMWWLLKSGADERISNLLSILMAMMLLVTGHLGGSLTHGEDYLWGEETKTTKGRKPVADINAAIAYTDVIDPILQDKCVACHGPNKQKGRLRLDNMEHILKGGKSSATVVPGSADKSKMMTRILLPPDDEDHMPPKEKPQLTEADVSLIRWWIVNGASATAKVVDLKPDATVLAAITTTEIAAGDEELPVVAAAPAQLIQELKSQGLVVAPVAQGSNLLYVSLVNCNTITDTIVKELASLQDQLYWLKAEGPAVTDELVAALGGCKQLKYLSLAHSSITISAGEKLKGMKTLERINVYGTALDSSGIKK